MRMERLRGRVAKPISISLARCCISEAEFLRHSSGAPTFSSILLATIQYLLATKILSSQIQGLVGPFCMLGALVVPSWVMARIEFIDIMKILDLLSPGKIDTVSARRGTVISAITSLTRTRTVFYK